MERVSREMTHEEEYDVLLKEAKELFDGEKEGYDPPFANCIVRRALRCIEKMMSGNKYQKLASRTMNDNLSSFQQEHHALHGMVGEIGEIHSLYQKIYQGHELNDLHLKKEVGDLLWFIAEYCTANEWNLEDVMQMNIDKLKERYPDGFKTEKSLHRKDGDI